MKSSGGIQQQHQLVYVHHYANVTSEKLCTHTLPKRGGGDNVYVLKEFEPKTPPNFYFTPLVLNKRNIMQRWETYISNCENISEPASETAIAIGDDDTLTGEDLFLLWALKNGKDGKLGKGKSYGGKNAVWSERAGLELCVFVHETHNAHPDIPLREWNTFFTNFGAEAKSSFLRWHKRCVYATKTRGYFHDLPHIEKDFHRIKLPSTVSVENEYLNKPLPIKLFPIFVKDRSSDVRTHLAVLHGLPEPISKILAEDDHLHVLYRLICNTETPPQNIALAVKKSTLILGNQTISSKKGRWSTSLVRRVSGVGTFFDSVISVHPNTPSPLLTQLVQRILQKDVQGANDRSILKAAYENPNMRKTHLRELCDKIKTDMENLHVVSNDLSERRENLLHTLHKKNMSKQVAGELTQTINQLDVELTRIKSRLGLLNDHITLLLTTGIGKRAEVLSKVFDEKLLRKELILGEIFNNLNSAKSESYYSEVGEMIAKTTKLTGSDLNKIYRTITRHTNENAFNGIPTTTFNNDVMRDLLIFSVLKNPNTTQATIFQHISRVEKAQPIEVLHKDTLSHFVYEYAKKRSTTH